MKVLPETDALLPRELGRLFEEHSRLVYRTAYSVTASPQEAEDVLQNLFLHLLRRGFPAGLKENPKAYLYRAAINMSLNALKSRRRGRIDLDAECPDVPYEPEAQDPTRGAQQRLVNAMAQLPPRTVAIINLHYEHGYSDAEIGKLLGCSRGVVAVAMYRARAKLKKLLRTPMNRRERN